MLPLVADVTVLVTVRESQVDLVKRTAAFIAAVYKLYKRVESLSCRSAQLCYRDETTIETGNVYTKGQQYT